MQSIHFGFALGAFIGPIVTEPFLSKHISTALGTENTSFHDTSSQQAHGETDLESLRIIYLYPLVGSLSLIVSLGYLATTRNKERFVVH